MAQFLKQHSNLQTHTPGFTLDAVATSYQVDLQGSIAAGSDACELQIFQNGAFRQLDPPVRFTPLEVNGSKLTGLIPANATLRWFVPFGNNISTKITSSHG
jgi:hypothetical protein